MKKPLIAVFAVLLSLIAGGVVFSEETVHVMRQGETIYSIARSYGVNPQELLSFNKISDPRVVRAGQRIRIPGASTGTSASGASSSGASSSGGAQGSQPAGTRSAYGEYRVERNDTLYSIARRYGVPVAELLEINGFAPNYVLKAGEKIRVPGGGSGQAVAAGNTGAGGGNGNGSAAGSAGTAAAGNGAAGNSPANGNGRGGTAAASGAAGTVRWPVRAKEVSYLSGKLYGVQVTGEQREPVKSLTRGTVVSAGPYRGFGRVAIVQMNDGYLYVYGGCETLSVKEGDKVTPGTELGKLGIDAKTAKPQLFFLVYRGNTPVDPAKAPRA